MTVRRSGAALVPGVLPRQVQPVVGAALCSLSGAVVTRGWDGFVEVSTGFSFGSWGEIVGANLTSVPEGTQVEVRSESKWALTLVDYGKCSKNVERILRSALAGYVVP